jgi:NAD(P)-dependent dehydrogenase (short-subunit alcohol dehydrogenase family)
VRALGRRALVVGGETPLGRAVAVGLAEEGADVAIASLSSDTKAEFAINSALNELWALGRRGLALAIDASDAEQLRAAVARAEAELGRLDLAVVVSSDRDAVALEALREALAGREIQLVTPDATPQRALQEALDALRPAPGP